MANLTQINVSILSYQELVCICEQLKRIADNGQQSSMQALVEIQTYPVLSTSVNPGQDGGPDRLYPLGWVTWIRDGVSTDRQTISYLVQQVSNPSPGLGWTPNLWLSPGVAGRVTVL